MTENTAPARWLRLAVAPAPEADPVTEPVATPVTGAVANPEVATGVLPMKPAERAQLTARHWGALAANGAGQLWFHPDRLGHSIYHGKPGSLAEHRAYIKSREWVPPDLDGKAAQFIGGSGVVYHLLIARPVKAACLTVSASADKPLRLMGLIALVLVFAIAVVPHIPLI